MHAVLPYKGYLWDMAGVILGLVVQIARPRLAPALRPVAATARAELSLRADGIAPIFLPATLPLRVSLLRHSLSLAHPPGLCARVTRKRGYTDRIAQSSLSEMPAHA